MPGHQVSTYFLDDPLLGSGQTVWKGVVAGVEVWSHLRHSYAFVRARTNVFLFEKAELQQKQFLELESAGGFLKGIAVAGEVYVLKRIAKAAQTEFSQHIVRKGFAYLGQAPRKGRRLQPAHHLAGNACVLEFLRARIHSSKNSLRHRAFLGNIHLRVDYVPPSVKFGRLAEKDETLTRNEPLIVPFDGFEKDHLHTAGVVFHDYAEPLGGAPVDALSACVKKRRRRPVEGPGYNFSQNLDIGEALGNAGNGLNGAAVHIAERIQPYQFAESAYSQLFFKKVGPFRTNPLKIHYVSIQFTHRTGLLFGSKTLVGVVPDLCVLLGLLEKLLSPFRIELCKGCEAYLTLEEVLELAPVRLLAVE